MNNVTEERRFLTEENKAYERTVNKTMKYVSRIGMSLPSGLSIILIFLFVMGMAQPNAYAACTLYGATDTDCDGFTDTEEQSSITLPGGTTYSACTGAEDRTTCLNYLEKDLFIILVQDTGTYIDTATFDPFEFISKAQADGGLGITVHVISSAQSNENRIIVNRTLSGSGGINVPQKAVRVSEDATTRLTNPNSEGLGSCQHGTPNGLDGCIIYTRRIHDFIDSNCGGPCTGPNGETGNALYNLQIQDTIGHEVGHSLNLTDTYNSRMDGWHERAGSNTIMQQNNKVSKGVVKIPAVYSAENQGIINLSY